jgi:hypothetical protein
MDQGFAQGDHRLLEIPHPRVLRFHRPLVLHRHCGFVVPGRTMGGGGKPDGEGGEDKKNARTCQWTIHRKASVRLSAPIVPHLGKIRDRIEAVYTWDQPDFRRRVEPLDRNR